MMLVRFAFPATVVVALFVCVGCAARRPAAPPMPAPLHVMTFNVRTSGANDGINAWANRRELALEVIRSYAPDLLGTQEVTQEQYDDLVAALPEMQIVGVARDDGLRKGEYSALLFRAGRFEQLDSGTFWLSETPEVAGSKSWDAALPRICTWARLRDRASGRVLLCANTHFDHRGRQSRENAARLLAERLPQLAAGAPVILMGDFNAPENGDPYRILAGPGAVFLDTYRAIHPTTAPDEATYHGFRGTTPGSRIDWILCTPAFKPVGAQIITAPRRGGVFPSDHYPVTAKLLWP